MHLRIASSKNITARVIAVPEQIRVLRFPCFSIPSASPHHRRSKSTAIDVEIDARAAPPSLRAPVVDISLTLYLFTLDIAQKFPYNFSTRSSRIRAPATCSLASRRGEELLRGYLPSGTYRVSRVKAFSEAPAHRYILNAIKRRLSFDATRHLERARFPWQLTLARDSRPSEFLPRTELFCCGVRFPWNALYFSKSGVRNGTTYLPLVHLVWPKSIWLHRLLFIPERSRYGIPFEVFLSRHYPARAVSGGGCAATRQATVWRRDDGWGAGEGAQLKGQGWCRKRRITRNVSGTSKLGNAKAGGRGLFDKCEMYHSSLLWSPQSTIYGVFFELPG